MTTAKIPPPPEAIKLGHCFYVHDYKWGIRDFRQWAKTAIRYARLNPTEKSTIKQYLTGILESSDNAVLGEVWHALGTAVVLMPPGSGGERSFLSTICDEL